MAWHSVWEMMWWYRILNYELLITICRQKPMWNYINYELFAAPSFAEVIHNYIIHNRSEARTIRNSTFIIRNCST